MSEAGEKEVGLAFEEATRKNVQAVIEHGNKTREMVQEFETKISTLQNMVVGFREELDNIKKQLALLLGKVYSKGTSEDS